MVYESVTWPKQRFDSLFFVKSIVEPWTSIKIVQGPRVTLREEKKSTKEESNETRLHVLFKLETIIRKRPSPIHPHVGQLSTSCVGERTDPLYDEFHYNMCYLQNT